MLWTDRKDLISDSYVYTIDSAVRDLLANNGVTLSDKIILGCADALENLNSRIESFDAGIYIGGNVSANHIAAVLNTGARSSVVQRFLPTQIVVDSMLSPIPRWIAECVLRACYEDLFNRNAQDLLKDKMELHCNKALQHLNGGVKQYGLPIVVSPLSAPAAELEPSSGSWVADNLSLVTSPSGTSSISFDVVITYVDMSSSQLYVSPSIRNNAESMPSKVAKIDGAAGSVISVDISTLNPPSGTQPKNTWQVCRITPLKATHWNLYIGASKTVNDGKQYLQNASPIPIDQLVYTLSADPLSSGALPGNGQVEDRRMTMPRVRRRS